MKKLVCGCLGNIYYATILKDGFMSLKDRVDLTDSAIDSVFYHLMCMDTFEKEGFAGYDMPNKNKTNDVRLCVYDTSKYKLAPIQDQ